MANGNDTDTDVMDESPDTGEEIGDQASAPTPTAAPAMGAGPISGGMAGTQQQPMGGNIQSLMQGGLAGLMQSPNVGPMVQQRHGGLLTGLAGVLLDGLASGMAPDAETAARMPMIRQQQAMQMQQMQLQQQKLQEEMRLQPVRDKLMLMQAQMAFMQVNHAMAEMTTQNQMGINDFTKGYIQDAIKGNRAEPLMEGTLDAAKQYVREHVHDPDGMQLYAVPMETDGQGNVTKARVVKILPEAWAPAVKKTIPYHDPIQDKDFSIKIDLPAGPQREQSVELGEQFKTQLAQISTETAPAKTPGAGLMQAIKQAQQAGKSGQAVFDDPNVKTAIQAIQATQKPGGGFESEAYQQYAQGEQAKGRQPLSMVEFQRRLWPQTVIAAEHAAIAEKGEARKETEAANWIPGSSGMMKNKASLAENVSQNSNAVAQILMRRPDILGIVQGRISAGKTMFGTNDPDLTSVGTAIHNIAISSQGIHGMRSPEEVARFEQKLFNNFKNGRKATVAALLENARSVQTFIDDARPETYRTHSRNGGALRAMTGQVSDAPQVLTEEPPEQ